MELQIQCLSFPISNANEEYLRNPTRHQCEYLFYLTVSCSYKKKKKSKKAEDTQVPSAEFPQEVPYSSQWPAEICCFQTHIPSWHRRNTLPLNFRWGCLDKDGDVCMPGHKKKAFCGVIYYSNRPWQQLDSMVIMNNQAPKEEMRAFLLPGPAARRSRWSQFRHGLQYF